MRRENLMGAIPEEKKNGTDGCKALPISQAGSCCRTDRTKVFPAVEVTPGPLLGGHLKRTIGGFAREKGAPADDEQGVMGGGLIPALLGLSRSR